MQILIKIRETSYICTIPYILFQLLLVVFFSKLMRNKHPPRFEPLDILTFLRAQFTCSDVLYGENCFKTYFPYSANVICVAARRG